MRPTKISKYFVDSETYASALAERKGIDNSVPARIKPVVVNTAIRLDRVREFLGAPIVINSWYRCLELNTLLGSKPTSQHVLGEAVDFIAPNFGTPAQICKLLAANVGVIDFDQLIFEYSWVHISFKSNPQLKQRHSVLTLDRTTKTYIEGVQL